MNGRCANVLRSSTHGVEVFGKVGGMGTTAQCYCAGAGGGARSHTCQACLGVGYCDPAQLWLPAAGRLEKGGQRNIAAWAG